MSKIRDMDRNAADAYLQEPTPALVHHPETLEVHIYKGNRWNAEIVLNTKTTQKHVMSLAYQHTKDEVVEAWNAIQMAILTNSFEVVEHDKYGPDEWHHRHADVELDIQRGKSDGILTTYPFKMIGQLFKQDSRAKLLALWEDIERLIKEGDFVVIDEHDNRVE
jgi:hypothetical protein